MAYGAWNQELSNDYYGEKVNIYGSNIVKSAYKAVYEACHKSSPSYLPTDLCLSDNRYIYFLFFLLLVLASVIIGFIVRVICKYYNDHEKEITIHGDL